MMVDSKAESRVDYSVATKAARWDESRADPSGDRLVEPSDDLLAGMSADCLVDLSDHWKVVR